MVTFLLEEQMRYDIESAKIENICMVESVGSKLQAFTNMIQSILKLFKDYIIKLKDMLKKEDQRKQIAMKLSFVKKDLHRLEAAGVKYTQFVDTNKLDGLIEDATKFIEGSLNRFMSMYYKGLAGAIASESFLAMFNHGLESYSKKIEECLKTKKTMRISDVVRWIESNITWTGRSIGNLEKYQNMLDKATKEAERIAAAAKEYEDQNGYIMTNMSFKNMVNNITVFAKKNYDWITLYSLSGVSMIGSLIAKKLGKPHYYDQIYEMYPQLIGEDLEDIDKWYNYLYNNPDIYKNNYKVADNAFKAASAGLATAASAEMYNAMKNERRNSINLD